MLPHLRISAVFLTVFGPTVALCAQDTRPLDHDLLFVETAQKHCFSCHGDGHKKGGVAVDRAIFDRDRDTLARLIEQVRGDAMPPDDRPRPTVAEKTILLSGFEKARRDDSAETSDPGSAPCVMRRLTRDEFEHTVHDLFGIGYDAKRTFPSEATAYGFEKVSEVLSLAPLVFEKYFDAATEVSAKVLADPAARARLLDAAGESGLDDAGVWRVVEKLITRAWRRPVGDDEILSRTLLFRRIAQDERSIDAALDAVLRSVVLSPYFLFRVEIGEDVASPTEAPSSRPLTAHETATRLSYFLWSTMPDARLREAADNGSIKEPPVLESETRRMLADEKSRALADGFAAQWLRFRDVLTAPADFRRYPEIWNERLRPSMYEEAALFFDDIVKNDRDVRRLLDCDETFLNGTLAAHYGIKADVDAEMKLVKLPDRRRGGVLGMGAILLSTSHPLRTSPVLRGKWILDQLIDDPPPPPPANAGTLPGDDQLPDGLTQRQRLERHRQNPSCAACHARIDPLGFSLENYDVTGKWRTEVQTKPIDTKGTLPDGREIDGPIALKDALLADGERFVATLTKKLMVYAIGRSTESADEKLVASIAKDAFGNGAKFSAIVLGIVRSRAFLRISTGGPRK